MNAYIVKRLCNYYVLLKVEYYSLLEEIYYFIQVILMCISNQLQCNIHGHNDWSS